MSMFRAQQGYRGCIMARRGEYCEVLTLWEDEAAIEAVEASESYKETVARIRAAGFISKELGSATIPIHEIEVTIEAVREQASNEPLSPPELL
jgi:heme-degrading monooxygenase HmoA